ncbi:MAG TPA: sigma-70 family RNA polymerase sigma factor [Nannocystaceae bacterium]|nr:sigma-70 family RNA polymerase sigma factor [Nannocystaceae bacterium]
MNAAPLPNDDAFGELVLAHAPAMLATARRLLAREADAEDAVQDACLAAFRALDRFDGRASLATWLHRIVLNSCLMRLRAARRRPERAIEELLPQFLDDGHQREDTRPWRPHALAELERAELCALVRAKIDELPQPYREVLLLRDIEGLDTDETARMLATSCGALKVRLHRARQALRTLLEPYHVEATT